MRAGVLGTPTVVARVHLTVTWNLEVMSLVEAKSENACILRIDKDSGKIGCQLLMALLKTSNGVVNGQCSVMDCDLFSLLRAVFGETNVGGRRLVC